MKIIDFIHPYLSISLTNKQEIALKSIIKKNKLKMQIFRHSINLLRFKIIYENSSNISKKFLERAFSKIKLRSGHSKLVDISFNITISPELCELYGYLSGDGSVLKVCRFYNGNSIIISRVNYLLRNQFNIKLKYERKTDYFIPKVVQVVLEEIFGIKGLSREVKVPKIIYQLPKLHQKVYVRALFDTDGCVKNGPPKLTSKSLNFLRGVRKLLLTKFKIESRIIGNENTIYDLYIGNGSNHNVFFNTLKFYEEINFFHPEKKRELEEKIKRRTLYKTLQLVRRNYNTSSIIRDKLNKDWSTVIEHLNRLQEFEFLNKIKTNEGNKHIWIVNKSQERKI
ncbi:MAG: LAGLIDADG family homing endonuclease [Candidatus Aenigmatarchaeota archaeon]